MGLNIHNVSVSYGAGISACHAVRAASLYLKPGELGVLIGPSGCGKSSLLRAIAGLQAIDSGDITSHGRTISRAGLLVPPSQRGVGMVFQDYALFPHMNVQRNVRFGIAHLAAAEQARRTRQMLELVGLADAGAAMPHELSGGQQQRVALARALVRQPEVLLLDEPFGSLDASLRGRLAAELRTILQGTRTTALMVTHDQSEAFALADTVGVMQQGHITQWSSALALYQQPATRAVAEFVGRASFLPVLVKTVQGKPMLCHALGCWPAPAAAKIGQNFDLLVRPEAVVIDATAPVQAVVLQRTLHEGCWRLMLQMADNTQLLAQAPLGLVCAVGARLGIRLLLQQVVAFEARRNGG